MRIVNFKYIAEASELMKDNDIFLSNKRLRRLAYLDVHKNNYKSYSLYMNYKKIMNNDAANNQTIAILVVILLIVILTLILFVI